jgi:hypothetical protein
MSDLLVEARPDPVREEVPVRFGLPGGSAQRVAAVLDWWPGEGHRYFRVLVPDGAEYVLRHDLATDTWRLESFRLEPLAPARRADRTAEWRDRLYQ